MIPTMCFDNEESAGKATALLQEQAIKAAVHPVNAKVSHRRYFPVFVREVDLERALDCVTAAKLPGTVKCSECQSINVEFPQAPQASAGFHAMAKLGEMLGAEKSFYCHACRNNWTEHEAPEAGDSQTFGKA